jgi:hypothetical protein
VGWRKASKVLVVQKVLRSQSRILESISFLVHMDSPIHFGRWEGEVLNGMTKEKENAKILASFSP